MALRFHDVVFDDDLLGFARDDGEAVRLTRQERALLREFIAHPRRLLGREQLLAVLRDDPTQISDRSVDFIINRLRRKLNDPARQPRFIATQYGEGYTWLAPPITSAVPALLVLGPVLGPADVLGLAASKRLLARLRAALEQRAAPGAIAMHPQWHGDARERGCRFSLEVGLRREGQSLLAALTLRRQPGDVTLDVRQLRAAHATGLHDVASIADAIMTTVWRRLAVRAEEPVAPTDAPLAVRLHDAALALNPTDHDWARIAPKLAADCMSDPADPRSAIIWATYLHSRLLRRQAGDPADPATYQAVEDEVEGLVFANLPAVRTEPAFALAAASLLVGVHRNHEDFAEKLVAGVLADSPAFAMALPILGQIEAKRGRLDQALARFDEALRLCAPGTEAEIFLLVLKARTLVAGDARDSAREVFERIELIKPLAGRQLGLIYLRPGEEHLTAGSRQRLDQLDAEQARRVLGFQYYMVARRFGLSVHRSNIMAGPMDHLIRRFGRNVVPIGVAEALGAGAGGATIREPDPAAFVGSRSRARVGGNEPDPSRHARRRRTRVAGLSSTAHVADR